MVRLTPALESTGTGVVQARELTDERRAMLGEYLTMETTE